MNTNMTGFRFSKPLDFSGMDKSSLSIERVDSAIHRWSISSMREIIIRKAMLITKGIHLKSKILFFFYKQFISSIHLFTSRNSRLETRNRHVCTYNAYRFMQKDITVTGKMQLVATASEMYITRKQ